MSELDDVERFDFDGMNVKAEGRWVSYRDYAAARAEIERLNNALTEAANQISDLSTRLGQAEGRLEASELVGIVEGWKARAEKAEDERDEAYGEVTSLQNQLGRAEDYIRKVEAERDQAVAAAFEAGARRASLYLKEKDLPLIKRSEGAHLGMADAIRALTPADAQAALGAQLAAAALEGERKGMQMAAEIAGQKSAVLPHYPDVTRGYAAGRSASRADILAEMEKLK